MSFPAGGLLARIAAYGARDAVRELPPEVVHHAKRVVVDWFSALYPGTRVSPAVNLVRAHARELGAGRSSLPGFATTAHPATAAWINGSASHSVEFDDIFKDAAYHPGCPVISAALAIAEDRALSGAELLAAITVGYEISTRIGTAVQPSHYRFFHTTGTVGAFGAAAAAAALLAPGDEGVMGHSIATAGTFASGLQQAFRSDAMTKPLHAGHAASVGVTSAMGAACGVTGAGDILEGPAGFGAAMSEGARWERAVDGLGERYNITRITQKNHGCCGHAFAAIDAALELRARGTTADKVESICVESYQAALDVAGNPDPRSATEAKFSIPYVVAHAMLHGSVRLDAFEPARLGDEAIRGLMRRVSVRVDRDMTARFPGQRAARVVIATRDGERMEHFAPHRKGDPEAPLSDADIDAKFSELVGPVLGPARTRELLGKLHALETLPVAALELSRD
ncbi:MAG TPA: MmgE/PrpD family protein [Usitatibacter sp.]|nr:MmgE/PrpD family protein [Usitatibacter sp.]